MYIVFTPGPKGLPALGNVNDLPKPGKLERHHWAEHKDRYGQCKISTVRMTIDTYSRTSQFHHSTWTELQHYQ